MRELADWRLAESPERQGLDDPSARFDGKPKVLELWQRYYVPDIAVFFGEDYKQNVWRMSMEPLANKKIMILLANVSTQDLSYENAL